MYLCSFDRRTKEQIIFQQKQVKRLLAQGENLLNPCNQVDKKTYVLMFFCQDKPVYKTLVLLSKSATDAPATCSDSSDLIHSASCSMA